MVNGSPQSPEASGSSGFGLQRSVSSMNLVQEKSHDSQNVAAPKKSPRKRSRSNSSSLTRQVSHDGLVSISEKENGDKKQAASDSGRATPIRCVSEFDKVASSMLKDGSQAASVSDNEASRSQGPPSLPNPLHRSPGLLDNHCKALRLEADLHPMKLVLSRLMANLSFNRKGIFNAPVDPAALGLPDYFDIVKKPMDLGTVKVKLHSVEYHSRRAVADDIRLCFRNAMTYNPANNIVHASAKELLSFFEEQIDSFCPELVTSSAIAQATTPAPTARQVTPPTTTAPATDVGILRTVSALDSEAGGHPVATTAEAALPLAGPSPAPSCQPCQPVHTLSTRKSAPVGLLSPPAQPMACRKRKKRGAKTNAAHNCQWCQGSNCSICNQGCLALEPTLLICNGPYCAGAKVRKGSTYYIAPDGSCQYCPRCYAGLSAVLPQPSKADDGVCRYKRELLKRKNDEEVVERWVTCTVCSSAVHHMCAMYNPFVHDSENFVCPSCTASKKPAPDSPPLDAKATTGENELFSFVAGSELPVPMSNFSGRAAADGLLTADALPQNPIADFIEEKVRKQMLAGGCPENAEKTVTVRIISDCQRCFKVPEVVRTHFRMGEAGQEGAAATPPTKVNYRSKAIALFQKIDGLDVCIFCMYVQEYDNEDEYEHADDAEDGAVQQKRVYIAYLDSVEHFRPRSCRTLVYQEVLTAYLATARKRGYEAAHIWACPPSRGNSFVFWNHPAAQRTPNMERLTAWYFAALSRSMDCGVVSDVMSLYESDFQASFKQIEDNPSGDATQSAKMLCPPLLDGDFWIEESVRIHDVTIARHLKEKAALGSALSKSEDSHDPCPAIQVAAMLRDKIIAHPSSFAFRRPVNAAAMKLKDYHKIVVKPMDLSTVHSRCALGEYLTLGELVEDVELVFSNAKKFNPPGHFVHTKAVEVGDLFLKELTVATETWHGTAPPAGHSWTAFTETSMNLGATLKRFDGMELVESSVISEKPATMESSVGQIALSLHSEDKSHHEPKSPPASTLEPPATTAASPKGQSGPDAVHHRMVGGDKWLLNKKQAVSAKGQSSKKKRRKNSVDSTDEPTPKRRRQSWLGEQVGTAVRRMRTSFFKCTLASDTAEAAGGDPCAFAAYAESFQPVTETPRSSRVADARHALLEFSQTRSLEFDTLRRAKYSSAILLYHLHHDDAPGLMTTCTSCTQTIDGVRWHRISKVVERRPAGLRRAKQPVAPAVPFHPEELCASCHSKHQSKDQFIPLQVSF